MTVGEAMRAAREKAGLTQAALSKITGISPVTLNQYENDRYSPRLDIVEMLADTLGVSIDEYVGHGTGENYTPDVKAVKRAIRLTTALAVESFAEKVTKIIAVAAIKEMGVDLNDR